MANTRTVGASGANHTTIAAAMSWFQANHDFGTDGIGTIEIIDNAEYNENVSISGITGTETASAYMVLTAASANKHEGVAGTGHARIRGSVNGSHVISIDESYTVVKDLEIQQDSSGDSDEAIRSLLYRTGCLISNCIIWSGANANNQDGVYMGNWGGTITVDHCVIYSFTRAGLHAQHYSNSDTQTWNIDSCSVMENARGIYARSDSGTTAVNIFNTTSMENVDSVSEDYSAYDVSVTWAGSNNIASDTSAESKFTSSYDSVSLVTSSPASGENFWVTNRTSGSEDYSLAGENAYTVNGNGVDRTGSEPDTRQDFSVDIAGNARHATTPDIGAFEFVAAGGATAAISFLHRNQYRHILTR